MINQKEICAGNIGDITLMCRPAMLPMMKHGDEAVGSKVNFPFIENCLEVYKHSMCITVCKLFFIG